MRQLDAATPTGGFTHVDARRNANQMRSSSKARTRATRAPVAEGAGGGRLVSWTLLRPRFSLSSTGGRRQALSLRTVPPAGPLCARTLVLNPRKAAKRRGSAPAAE